LKLPVAHVFAGRGPNRFLLAMALVMTALLPTSAIAAQPNKTAPDPVTIQLLNVSDWHGNLDPVNGIGGAWNISARWKEDRQAYPTLTLTAGDDFGATPALSGFFNEVPAILAERLMGIQVNTLGNHNFDRGVDHLQQMINLARKDTSAEAPGTKFHYVSANLRENGDLRRVKPWRMYDVGGVKVAVIGITNEEAPTVVTPGAFGDVVIRPSIRAANKAAKRATEEGADVTVVITHKGVRGFNSGQPFGELIDFANGLNPEYIDVVMGDHTDIQWSGDINGILVHENRSFGVTYAKTLITAIPGAGVTDKSVTFVSPGPAGSLGSNNTSCVGGSTPAPYCDQAIVDMLVPYRQQLAAQLDGKIATTALPFDRGGTPSVERSGEAPLGDLMADGMRARYNTQLGLMNSGGIRQQLPTCSYLPQDTTLNRGNWDSTHTTVTTCSGYGAGTPYDIVLGDVFSVLPFGNNLLTRTVTGSQLWLAMENGVSRIDSSGNGADGRFPQISGFKFSFRYDIPTGCHSPGTPGGFNWTACNIARVQSMALTDGTPIPNDGTTYTLTLPNFTNTGGDSYFMFADGQGTTQELDATVFGEYIESLGTLNPANFPPTRITECNGPC
jgi:5'-nucleotidase